MSPDDSLPAILGGPAVRPQGPPPWPITDPAIAVAVERSLHNGDWGRYDGAACRMLRERLAERHAAEHVLLCSSGTVAVELALRGLNLASGDEVLVAGYDYRGNFLNVVTVGATPVLVDVQQATGQLDPAQAAVAITSRTRAMIATHLHGGVVDMAALRSVADDHGLAIIEDACQMPGALLGTRRAGMQGDVGVISFGGSKLLSAGRGGAILTNRSDIAARIRRYGFRGNESYPLSELQAAVLLPQLDALEARRTERRSRVAELFAGLGGCPALTALHRTSPPVEPDFYKVGIRYQAGLCGGLTRELFAAAMQAEGIAVFPGFRGLHRLHARSRFRQVGDLSESTRADSEWLVLHHPVLLSGTKAIEEIISAVHKVQLHADRLRETKRHVGGPTSPWEGEP